MGDEVGTREGAGAETRPAAPPVAPPAAQASARFAARWLASRTPPSTTTTLGAFELHPHQIHAVSAILASLARFGGALLADPPGSGKTIVALAVAARLTRDSTLVLAPAALRAQWESTAARAAVPIRFASLESLSQGSRPARTPLVIVDEAHQARTPRTRRYRTIARLAIQARILLLSATPVVNRRSDLDALLSLFLGSRRQGARGNAASRCVFRRIGPAGPTPVLVPHPELRGDGEIPALAEALRRLPPPFPLVAGADATPLVRLTLAHAWSSSLAALDAALTRRLQRGAAIGDLLAAGRSPCRTQLRSWIVGEDATQLALAGLFDAGEDEGAGASEVLRIHLNAVRALRAMVRPRVAADTAARVASLLALANAYPARRLVVFAQRSDTLRALWGALRHRPGTLLVSGTRTLAAAGRFSRSEVLDALGPRARPLRPRDPLGIRLVLTTDLLAEGIELQGVGIVVHADRPWTPARIEQREGRAARAGGIHGDVIVARFAASAGAESVLALDARLRHKRVARRRAVAAAEALAQIDERMRGWRASGAPSIGRAPIGTRVRPSASLALVRAGDRIVLLVIAGRTRRVSANASALLAAVEHLDLVGAESASPRDLRRVRLALGRWDRARRVRALLGGAVTEGAAPSLRALHRRVHEILSSTAFADRPARAANLAHAAATLAANATPPTLERLARLLRQRRADESFVRRLLALARTSARGLDEEAGNASPAQLMALLVPRATSRDPPASAAPPRAPPAAST